MRRSRKTDLWMKKLGTDIDAQRAHREFYFTNCRLLELEPTKVLTIIHDKMYHWKTAFPHFSYKNKAVESFIKLPIAVIGNIAHGHGDVRHAHYGLDIYCNLKHIIGSIAKLLKNLEFPLLYSIRQLFVGGS